MKHSYAQREVRLGRLATAQRAVIDASDFERRLKALEDAQRDRPARSLRSA